MIQEKLDRLQPYFRGLKMAENYKIVELNLKKSWSIEQDEEIMVNQKETKEGGNALYTMFYSDTKTFDEILDFVEEKVINYNLEVEEKERLLKAKVEELKRVFETKSLDELNHLKFTTEEDSLKLNSKLSSSSTNGAGNNVGTVNTTTNKVEKVS
jgi:uncharacterized Zn finger protein